MLMDEQQLQVEHKELQSDAAHVKQQRPPPVLFSPQYNFVVRLELDTEFILYQHKGIDQHAALSQ